MWFEGTIEYLNARDRYDDPPKTTITYEVLAFAEPSEYGYRNGRVSKIELRINNNRVLYYDRKFWETKPLPQDSDYELIMKVFKTLISLYN